MICQWTNTTWIMNMKFYILKLFKIKLPKTKHMVHTVFRYKINVDENCWRKVFPKPSTLFMFFIRFPLNQNWNIERDKENIFPALTQAEYSLHSLHSFSPSTFILNMYKKALLERVLSFSWISIFMWLRSYK